MTEGTTISEAIERADQVLRTAYAGLEMMKTSSGTKKNLGLRNVLIFARSVTFVIQNIRGKDDRFDEWYEPHQSRMKNDPVFSYFRDARNNLEKQGRLELLSRGQIKSFSSEDLKNFQADRPPGASGFFVLDDQGGSGWKVELPNGEELHYYVDMPTDLAVAEQSFGGELAKKFLGEDPRSTIELCDHVLSELSKIVDSARQFFLSEAPAQLYSGKRLPRYLRIIK